MVGKKRLKILYVCPFAHYTGHFAWEAANETYAMARTGVEVELLTFCGVTDEVEVKVPHLTTTTLSKLGGPIYRLANFLRRWGSTLWISMFLETYLTLTTAIRLKEKLGYDTIHLRDGEPFLFLPHLLSLNLKNYNWVISVTGSGLIALNNQPSFPLALRKGLRQFLNAVYIRVLHAGFWKPVYRRSLAKNRFVFLTQNETIQKALESYMGGVLWGRVFYLPLGVPEIERTIPRDEARKHFGLPRDKAVFLSFGFVHVGKDMDTVFRALGDIRGALLLHGGDEGVGAESAKLENIAVKYTMRDRAVIQNYYIPEEEKPYYFFAADAVILSYTKVFLATTSLLWQACRYGIPVIASDNGQLKELTKKYKLGLIFKAQNPDSLRETLISFIKLKPSEIKKLKENCHEFAHEFSHEKWAQRCLEIYNKLLADDK
jgi:glycosyltransferase involved in cell wall biosynthesis